MTVRRDWPERKFLNVGEKNAQRVALVKTPKSCYHRYTSHMDRAGSAFKYFSVKFPQLSEANIKEGAFWSSDPSAIQR